MRKRRKPLKPTKRYMSAVYLSPPEREMLHQAARAADMPFSEFVRRAALAAARRRIPTPPQEISHDPR